MPNTANSRGETRAARRSFWLGAVGLTAAMLVLSGPAHAIIPATPIGDVLVAAQDLQTQLANEGANKRTLKVAKKMVDKLTAAQAGDSYVKGLKALSFSAKQAETKFATSIELNSAIDDAVDLAAATLDGARTNGGLMIPPATPIGIIPAAPIGKVGTVGKRKPRDPFRKERRLVTKTGKFLDKARDVERNPPRRRAVVRRIAFLIKAAKLLEPIVRKSESGQTMNWVISSVDLAPAGQGFDMDGDGDVDNNAAQLVGLVDSLPGTDVGELRRLLRTQFEEERAAAVLPVIRMWGIDSYSNDNCVFVGLMNGVDCDDDVSNNFSGTEPYDVERTTAADGNPFLRAPTSFDANGNYVFVIDGNASVGAPLPVDLDIARIQLPGDIPLGFMGQASPTANDGIMAFAIPVQRIINMLDSQLPIPVPAGVATAIGNLADLDVNGDGTDESISTQLAFTSVPCVTKIGAGESICQCWVVEEVVVLGAGEGEDFTGDGVPDNALGELQQRINDDFRVLSSRLNLSALINDSIAARTRVGMVCMWGIQDFVTDPRVFVGVANALDTDGNTSDNFSGSETFNGGPAVDGDGKPVVRLPTSLAAGAYDVTFDGVPFEVGDLPIDDSSMFHMSGDVTPSTHSGELAFTVSAAAIIALLEDRAPVSIPNALKDAIRGLADVPTADPNNGLLSVALTFEAVSATLE